jgi:predicted Holliday junction resolvase-like endonuclease
MNELLIAALLAIVLYQHFRLRALRKKLDRSHAEIWEAWKREANASPDQTIRF